MTGPGRALGQRLRDLLAATDVTGDDLPAVFASTVVTVTLPDGSHAEPSLAVVGWSRARALTVARAFDQAAVFELDATAYRVVWCDPDDRPGGRDEIVRRHRTRTAGTG